MLVISVEEILAKVTCDNLSTYVYNDKVYQHGLTSTYSTTAKDHIMWFH